MTRVFGIAIFLIALASPALRAADAIKPLAPIEFEEETLPNGLRVIYAPLHQAPVVHVRVLYHVGSKDERPDRQGFAHMFEHMMFRGSAHVAPQEHMKLVGTVGGSSNAFTSFDQTVYVNTVPAEHLEMVLYLEADRMASFKVNETIYDTERKVVAEEWRIRQNKPYGTLFEKFLKTAFTTHSYRWTPIGVMEHLQAAKVAELQNFFNTYYLPNNAVLVISGDINVAAAKKLTAKYFGWIPAAAAPPRDITPEPEQKEARVVEMPDRVPLPAVVIGYHLPPYRSDDTYALSLLGTILSGGRSARLDRELVYGEKPLAVQVSAGPMELEDGGVFTVSATTLQGQDPKAVESFLVNALAKVVADGVTQEELDKAKAQVRVGLIDGRKTADDLATQLGQEALVGGDTKRANEAAGKIAALTTADVQAVARKYLQPARSTTLRVSPDPTGAAAAKLKASEPVKKEEGKALAGAAERNLKFPTDWPQGPVMAKALSNAAFAKGDESRLSGVRLLVMSDHRLPLATWSLTLRRGSHGDPAGKEGLAELTDDMVRRGPTDTTFEAFNNDLESRGITIEVSDGGDVTRLTGSCPSDQLNNAFTQSKQLLISPAFDEKQFEQVKKQMVNQLILSQESPRSVAETDLSAALWGTSPMGRSPTPKSVDSITLDDVKACYKANFSPEDMLLVIAGDVTREKGNTVAAALCDEFAFAGDAPPPVDYTLTHLPKGRRIILVDRPGAKQATVRMGVRAYTNKSDEKFPGSVAGQILTSGIHSRLNQYVRADKGLAYGVHGVFQPGRQSGAFIAGTDTAAESAGAAVEAMFKVFNDMRKDNVLPRELSEAQMRVAGSMVMGMQTIQQQATYRVEGILNGYPIDYFDVYPEQIAKVTADQVRDVMSKYVEDAQMVIVVVAPAEAVKAQLEKLGTVEVVPMPAQREGAKKVDTELLKKAA